MFFHKAKKKLNRSRMGNALIFLGLCLVGFFMALPLIYSITSAFKPMEEIFLFPPEILYVRHPTMNNFTQLFQLTSSLWVPFSRYIFNSTFVCLIATAGNIFICSMAAYPLAKHHFPGDRFIFKTVQTTLLFTGGVTALPLYIVEAKLGMINTYWALILPLSASPMSLYLMRQFMIQINDAVIEAARIDGATEFRIYRSIIMPWIKPAWLTVLILAFQNVWNNTGGNVIYSEQLKMLPTALAQIQQGGLARVGVGAAASLLLMIPPIVTFIITQSNIIETMGQSGMKD